MKRWPKDKNKTKQVQTCDSIFEHRRSRSLAVDRGDGHIVLSLGDEAGQVQGGDATADFNLPWKNVRFSTIVYFCYSDDGECSYSE